MVFFLVLLTVTAFITLECVMEKRRKREREKREVPAPWGMLETAAVPAYRSPAGLFYHSGHTWAHLNPTGEANVGIDDFAQGIIGAIERFELPPPGTVVRQGERAFSVVQKNKKIDFVSPIDGIVKSVNKAVTPDSAVVKRDPYVKGWLLTVEPVNLIQNLKKLKVGKEAFDWLERETKRFVEFLSLHAARPQEVGVTMHDGGLYIEGVVENIDGELLQILARKFFR